MPINSEKVLSLYNYMKECGDDVGTWEHFKLKFFGDANYASRKKVFDALKNDPYADVGGSYEEFMTRLQRGAQRLGKAPAAQQQKQSTQVAPAQSDPHAWQRQGYNKYNAHALEQLYNAYKESAPDAAPADFASFDKTYRANNDAGLAYRRGVYKALKDKGYQIPSYEDMQDMVHNVKVAQLRPRGYEEARDKTQAQFEQGAMPTIADITGRKTPPIAQKSVTDYTTDKDGKRVPYVRNEPVKAKGRDYGEPLVVLPHDTENYKLTELADDRFLPNYDPETKTYNFRDYDYSTDIFNPEAMRDVSAINKGNALRSGKIGNDMYMTNQDRLDVINQLRSEVQRRRHYVPTYATGMAANDIFYQSNASEYYSREDQKQLDMLDAAERAIQDSQDLLDEANRGMSTTTPWYSFSGVTATARGFGKGLFDMRTWDFGARDLHDIIAIRTAMDKYDRGEKLTGAEQSLLDALATKAATEAYFSDSVGYGYKMGQVTAQSLPFMLEMMINPASTVGSSLQARFTRYAIKRFGSKLARDAGKRITEDVLRGGIGEGVRTVAKEAMTRGGRRMAAGVVAGKAASRIGGDVIGSAAMSATTGQARVIADAINRNTGQARFDTDKDGKIIYVGHDAPEAANFFKAYAKAFAANSIENHSEMVGEYFGLVSKWAKAGFKMTKLDKVGMRAIGKLGMGQVIEDFVKGAKRSDINKALDAMLKRAHYNGMVGEYLEEVVGNIENALVVGDNTLDAKDGTGVFNAKLNLETFLGVSLMCGAISTWHAAGYRTPLYNAKKALKKADKAAAKLFGAQGETWNNIKLELDNCRNNAEKQAKLETLLMDRSMRQDTRKAILDYVHAKQYLEGIQLGTINAYADEANNDDERGTRRACRSSYSTGQNIRSAGQRRFAMHDFKVKQQAARAIEPDADLFDDPELYSLSHPQATEEQKKAMSEYAQAKAMVEGIQDAIQSDYKDVTNNAQASVDRITNKDTGKVIQVQLQGHDGPVYVRSGRVVIDADGYVDHTNSSKTVVFVDEDGRVISGDMDAGNIFDKPIVSEPQSVVDGIKQKAEAQRTAATDALEGRMSFQPGSSFHIIGTDGQTHIARIETDEQSGQPTVRMDDDEDVEPLTDQLKSSLQTAADQWMDQSYKEYQRAVEEQRKAQEAKADAINNEDGDVDTNHPTPSNAIVQDSEVTYTDAEGNTHHGIVNGVTADGTYEIQFDQAPNGKSDVDTYTQDEMTSMGIVPTMAEEEAQAGEEGNADAVAPEASAEGQTDASATQNGADEKQKAGNERKKTPKAIDRIPKDKKGKRNYEAAPVEDTAAALIENAKGDVDDAIETAGFMRKKTESLVEKAKADAEEAEDPETHQDIKNHIKVLEQNVKYWDDVVKFLEDVKKGAEAQAEEEAKAEAEAQAAEEAKAEGAEEAKAEEATEDVPASEENGETQTPEAEENKTPEANEENAPSQEEEAKTPETEKEKGANEVKNADNKAVESEMSKQFDNFAAQLKEAKGEERTKILNQMKDIIARYAEENGYPVPEFFLTAENFLNSCSTEEREYFEKAFSNGDLCSGFEEDGKVGIIVEHNINFRLTEETLAHEYTHVDNREFDDKVGALVYAIEESHEVSRKELLAILEKLSRGKQYERQSNELISIGENPDEHLSNETLAFIVSRMVVYGKNIVDEITNNPTIKAIAEKSYNTRINEQERTKQSRKDISTNTNVKWDNGTNAHEERNSTSDGGIAERESDTFSERSKSKSLSDAGGAEENEASEDRPADGNRGRGRERVEGGASTKSTSEAVDAEEARKKRVASAKDIFDSEYNLYGVHSTLYDVEDGLATYVDDNGQPAIFLAGVDEGSYVGVFRDRSGRWSSKMENQSNDKEVFKHMISSVMARLPEGAEFYEHTSVSADGLRVLGQQLRHGFKPSGETFECSLNGADRANLLGERFKDDGSFRTIEHVSDQEFEHIKEVLKPLMESLGMSVDDIRLTEHGGRVRLTLPVLVKESENSHSTEKHSERASEEQTDSEAKAEDEGKEGGKDEAKAKKTDSERRDPDANLRPELKRARDLAKMMFPDADPNAVDRFARLLNVQPLSKKEAAKLEKIAKALGFNIKWVDDMAQNGTFSAKDKTITIARNSWHQLGDTFGHEMTHAIRSVSEEAYQELVQAVKDLSRNHQKELLEMVDRNYSQYKPEERWEEYVSDQVGNMIYSDDMANAILSKLNHPLIAKMRDVVDRMGGALVDFSFDAMNKARNAFGVESKQRKDTSEVTNAVENLRQTILDAYRKAHEKQAERKAEEDRKKAAEANRNNPERREAIDNGVSSVTDAANADLAGRDNDVKDSMRTEDMVESRLRAEIGRINRRKTAKVKWSKAQADEIINETRTLMESIHAALEGNPRYDEWAKRNPTMQVDWRDGKEKPVVTWSRNNVEYKFDVSADLLCVNNEGIEATLSSPDMVELMLEINGATKEGFTSADYMRLYETMRDLGLNVPCKGCFDAAARLKMLPSVSRKFVDLVNQTIDERNADPEAFDAALREKAKGAKKKSVEGLPVSYKSKEAAIRAGVAGDNLTEHISWPQLMSAEGQTKALSDWGGIFRAWQRTGAGRPKDKLLPEPYIGDLTTQSMTVIAPYGEKTPSFREQSVNVGTGLRRNSHSELRPFLAIDEIQFMRDAFIKGLLVFKYMKELDDVRLFGQMGVKFNMSFFPAFDKTSPVAGLDKDGNYIASEESVGSREFPYTGEDGKQHYDGMKGMQEAQKYVNENVSLSSVVFSVPHLIKALTDVPTHRDKNGIWGSLIPFHSSGADSGQLAKQGLGIARANGVGHSFMEEAFTDYGRGVTNFEEVQNDRFGKGWTILEGDKAGTDVEEGHKLEFQNGSHYYNKELGLHLFSSWFVHDNELTAEQRDLLNGGWKDVMDSDAWKKYKNQLKKKVGTAYSIDYNDKVREIGGEIPYKEACDNYIQFLSSIGLIPRFDFRVDDATFQRMCADAHVDPHHPKLGWVEGKGWSPIDSDAYYSLWCDYGMTDPKTGAYSPHRPVGYIDKNGNRSFKMPDNTVDIVRKGAERFSAERDREESMHRDVMDEFIKRSVEDGKLTQEQADAFTKKMDDGEFGVKESKRMELGHTFSNTKEDFDGVRERAIEENGIVMPNLNREDVRIVPIKAHEFGHGNGGSIDMAKKWAYQNLVPKDNSHLPTMRDGTPYTISKKAIDKYLSSSAVTKSTDMGVHLSVLQKLTDVIHESIEAEIHADYPKDNNATRTNANGYGENILIHRLYGAAGIDGQLYRIRTTMQEYRGSETNKPHSYQVTKIELIDAPGTAVSPDSSHLDTTSTNSISAAKLLKGVEKSYDPGKKLLDESETLPEGETKFSLRNEKSSAESHWERGTDNFDERVFDVGDVSKHPTTEFPKDMAYRETDINELKDILESGVLRKLPEGKTVEFKPDTSNDGGVKKIRIRKLGGNSHGGKGFSKGAPWSTLGGSLASGGIQKVLIGVDGILSQWQEGFHGRYSDYKDFSEIEHGKPLFLPFNNNGNVEGIHAEDLKLWAVGKDGKFYEIEPKDKVKESRRSPSSSELALRDAVVDRLRKSGLGVSLDGKEGQRVLDWANGMAREMRTYHGTHADFDHFDHSFMNSGEGAQAYGWGTYLTEVEGIGRTYAKQIADRKNPEFIDARFKLKDEKLRRMRLTEQYNNILEDIDARNKTRKRNQSLLDDLLEDRSLQVDTYGEESDDVKEIDRQISRLQKKLDRFDASEPEFVHQKAKLERDLADSEKALDELNAKVNELGESIHHHLYTVEIPDDTGSNYLGWDEKLTEEQKRIILNGLRDIAEIDTDEWDASGLDEDGEYVYMEVIPFALGFGEDDKVSERMKATSEFLSEIGIVGMRYPANYRRGGRKDGAKNYVIFNEKDAQITDHVRFFRGKDGEAYGFTVDGKIYLDPKKVNAETPIHEYAHLWSTALQQKDAKAWGNVVELMKGTGVWDEVRENYPELETDDEIADEVLATYSGQRGAERLREEMRKVSESDGSLTEKAAAISALERVRNAISRFWRKVAEMLGFRYTKAEDVADHVLSDLLEGRNPNVGVETDGKASADADEVKESKRSEEAEEEMRTIIERAKKDGTYMLAPNGKKTNLDERQWAQVRTQNFKDWFGDWENDPEHASKCVDENGEPMVVYHDTNSTNIVNRKTGQSFDNLDWKEKEYWDNDATEEEFENNWEERPFYIFDNKTHGRRSIEMPAFFFTPTYDEYHEYGNRTIAAYLNVRNPIVNPDIPNAGATDTAGEEAMNKYIAQGYDGFIREFDGEIDEFNAFYPNQIKSATDNNGEFSSDNNDVRYSKRTSEGADVEQTDNQKIDEKLLKYKLTDEQKEQISKQIDERIAELLKQKNEASHNTDHGNLAEPPKNVGYSPDESGVQGALHSDAKIPKGFKTSKFVAENIAKFVSDFKERKDINANNFAKEFIGEIQNANKQLSDYIHYVNEDGERIVIRLSDHSGNARNIIVMGKKSHKGFSIVIKTPEAEGHQRPFKANKWAKVLEFVYDNPDRDRLENIARSIFNLVDSGDYKDLADADNINESPKDRNSETRQESSEENEGNGTKFSLRTKPDPKKTQKVYKLMRLGDDGKLYPLFIGSNDVIEFGKWYDADSPNLKDLKSLSSHDYIGTETREEDGEKIKETFYYGAHLVNNETGEAIPLAQFKAERKAEGDKRFSRMGKNPNPLAVNWATEHGYRWIQVREKKKAQRRYGGEMKSYYNYGINGSGGVTVFAMRPGWHAGSLPTMRQIGKGSGRNLRDDSFVFVEGEVPADIDYNEEAQRNADKDIPDHIPTDGFYMKATNADAVKSQADLVGWYVAGSFKANRVISDGEARSIIDKFNKEHGLTGKKHVLYDYDREGGVPFSEEDAARINRQNGVKMSQRTTDSVQSLSRDVEEGMASLHDVTRDVKASLRNRNAAHTRVDGLAQAIYEKAVGGRLFRWDEAWHDSLKAVDELQKALVQERGKAISDIENVYLHAIHLSSVSANEMSEFRNHQVENLISAVHAIVNDRKLDVSQDELDIYLNAKHGPERNEFIARRKATEEADKKYGDDLKNLQDAYVQAADAYNNNPNQQTKDAMDMAKADLDAKQKERDDYEDAQYNDHRLNDDYSGLTAIFQKPGEHLTNQELEQRANDYVADMEQKVDKERIDNLWDAVKKANEFSLHKSYKAGLISKQQYEDTRKMYDWYVPLRGFKEDTAADVYDYVEHGTAHTQKTIRKAEGRVSRADEILANIMNMGSSAIINGNKNLVKQKLLNLAQNSHSGLLSISEAYYRKVTDPNGEEYDELVAMPAYILNETDPDVQRQAIAAWEAQCEQNPDIKKKTDGVHLKFREVNGVEKEHGVLVMRGGKEYMVWVNGNPKAAQAINGTNIVRGNGTLRKIGKVTRIMSQLMTSYNPSFLTSNAMRDFNSAMVVSTGKYGAKYALAFNNNVRKVFPFFGAQTNIGKSFQGWGMYSLYYKYKKGTLNMGIPMEKYFKEFLENGGETGYTQSMSVDEYKTMIEKELGKMRYGKVVQYSRNSLNLFMNGIEFLNRGVENACRFAAYMTSRQHGMSVLQSVQDAKEVSTNFNLHGSGALGNAGFREAYAFLNPAIQSLMQYIQITKQHPWRMVTMLGATLATGVVSAFTLAMMAGALSGGDGDDDNFEGDADSDYWNISPYTRRNYMLIPVPGKGNWVKIALAPEVRAIYGMGVIAAEAAMGRLKPGEFSSAMADQLMQFSPISFIDPATLFDKNNSDNTLGKQLGTAFAPTALEPFFRVTYTGTDFMGKRISGANDFNEDYPEWMRSNKKTSQFLIDFSHWLNNATAKHGELGEKGWWNWNPSNIGYVFNNYTGGIGQLYDNIHGLIEAKEGNKEFNETVRYIPVVNRLFTTTDNEYSKYVFSNGQYYYYKGIYDEMEKEQMFANKLYHSGDMTRPQIFEALQAQPDYSRYLLMKGWQAQLDKLKKLGKQTADPDKQDKITKQMNEIRRKAVTAIMYAEKNGDLDKLTQISAGFKDAKTDEDIQRVIDKRSEELNRILPDVKAHENPKKRSTQEKWEDFKQRWGGGE